MNFLNLNLAFTLSSIIASRAAAARTNPTNGIFDNRIEYKINGLDDKKLLEECEKFKNSEKDLNQSGIFYPMYKKLRNDVTKKMEEAREKLKQEEEVIDWICKQEPFSEFSSNSALKVLDDYRNEWDLRKKVFDDQQSSSTYLNGIALNGVINSMKSERVNAKIMLDNQCSEKSLTECYKSSKNLDHDIAPVKMSTLAQEIFGKLSDKDKAAWVKPHWEDMLKHLNVPEDRFAVSSIDSSLNLISILASNGNDLTAAANTLRNTINEEKNTGSKGQIDFSFSADLKLREKVIYAILSEFYFDEDDSSNNAYCELTLEGVKSRVKAAGRIVEGIVRDIQMGTNLIEDEVTTMMKAWFMADQMFSKNGFKRTVPKKVSLSTSVAVIKSVDVPATPAAPVASDGSVASQSDSVNSSNNVSSAGNTYAPKSGLFSFVKNLFVK